MRKENTKNDLTQISYVGKSIANDFQHIGITKISELKEKTLKNYT